MKKAVYEAIPLHPDESFTVREFNTPDNVLECPDTVRWHYHPEIEIAFVISGSGQRFVGDSIENYGPLDLVMIGPDMPHVWTRSDKEVATHCIVIQFKKDCFGAKFFEAPELRKINKMLTNARVGIQFSSECAKEIGQQMWRLLDATGSSRVTLLMQILESLARSACGRSLASVSFEGDVDIKMSRHLQLCHDYIIEHISETIRADEVARHLGMSSSSFSRHFRAVTDDTFVSFLNEVRVVSACKMLVDDSDKSIGEIAHLNGFPNLSNFNRRFREYHNMTPRDYRQKHARELAF